MPYYKDPQNKPHYLDDARHAHLLPAGCVEITDAEAATLQNPAPTAEQLHAALVASAQAALDVSDRVCLRCYKANVAFPAAWQTWTVGLRNIVNGSDTTSTALPTQPAYPAGT